MKARLYCLLLVVAAALAGPPAAAADWKYEHAFRGFLMRAPEPSERL